jgi:hypothetical protein
VGLLSNDPSGCTHLSSETAPQLRPAGKWLGPSPADCHRSVVVEVFDTNDRPAIGSRGGRSSSAARQSLAAVAASLNGLRNPQKMKGLEEEVQRPRGWRARLLRRKRAREEMRVVSFPHAPHTLLHPRGREPHYRDNRTSTTKYTPFTFLPKSLFEQYRCGRGGAARPKTPLRASRRWPFSGPCRRPRARACSRRAAARRSARPRAPAPPPPRRRVANIYFTLNAALSLTPYSPVRCVELRPRRAAQQPRRRSAQQQPGAAAASGTARRPGSWRAARSPRQRPASSSQPRPRAADQTPPKTKPLGPGRGPPSFRWCSSWGLP